MVKLNCIIPARSKSKRIKNKNIRLINGKPLISYVITKAKKSNVFKNIYVSTDSNKIKKISEKFGAEVPFVRSKKLSNDFSTTNQVIKDAVKRLKLENEKYVFCIYPTAIFINLSDIKKSLKLMKALKADIIISTSEFNSHPLRAFKIYKKKFIKMKNPKYKNKRTQDLTKLISDAGYFYIYNVEKLLSNNIKKMAHYMLKKDQGIDIDTIQDLNFVKKIAKINHLD